MPFTPAHIAAVLPFRRTRMVWSALVVGAVAPDLEYFLRMSPQGRYGHTFAGLFVFTLPLGLLTLWLFHAFVKTPFIELMPDRLERRLARAGDEFRFGGPVRFALIIVSLLVGICTHLIWDSFTHGNTWTTRYLHVLAHRVHLGSLGFVPFYKLLQHLSTVVGLAILLVWLAMWYRRGASGSNIRVSEAGSDFKAESQNAWPLRKILTLAAITAIALLGALFRALSSIGSPSNHSTLALFAGDFAATMIALLWWEFVALGIWRYRRQKK
jgi:hypothetical protein